MSGDARTLVTLLHGTFPKATHTALWDMTPPKAPERRVGIRLATSGYSEMRIDLSVRVRLPSAASIDRANRIKLALMASVAAAT